MLEFYLTYIQEFGNTDNVQWSQVKDAISKKNGDNLNKDVISRMGPSMKYHDRNKNDIKKRKNIHSKHKNGKKCKTDKSGAYRFDKGVSK